jgi:hypothetical protein
MTKTIQLSISNAIISGLGLLSTIIFQRYVIDEEYGSTLLMLGYASLVISVVDIGNDAKFLGQERNKKWDKSQILFVFFRAVALVFLIIAFSVLVDSTLNEFILFSMTSITGFLSRFISFSFLYESKISAYFLALMLNVIVKIASLTLIVWDREYLMFYILFTILAVTIIFLTKLIIKGSGLKGVNRELFGRNDLWYLVYGAIVVLLVRSEVMFLPMAYTPFEIAVFLSLSNLAMALPVIVTNSLFLIGLVSNEEQSQSHRNLRFILGVVSIILLLAFMSKFILGTLYGQDWLKHSNMLTTLFIAYIGGMVFAKLEPYFLRKSINKAIYARSLQMIVYFVLLLVIIKIQLGLYYVALAVLLNRIFIWIFYTYSYEKRIIGEN